MLNKSTFFSYVFNKIRRHQQNFNIEVDSGIASDKQAADIFNQEFFTKFSQYSGVHTTEEAHTTLGNDFISNSTETVVYEALSTCPTIITVALGGVSFRLLKSIARHIIRSPNTVFQLPFIWRHIPIIIETCRHNLYLQKTR